MPTLRNTYYFTYSSFEGETLPVVLIHGAGGTHLSWPPQVRRIPGYRIIAPDLPGHGKSGGRGHQTIHAYARSIVDLVEELNINRAAFVGHSMGGLIALSLALDYPDRAAAVGLISTGARLRVAPEILENAASPTTFYKAASALAAGFFTPQADPSLVRAVEADLMNNRPSVFHGDLVACNAYDELERTGEVRCPALICSGMEDRLSPIRYSQYLANEIPSSRLEFIPGAAHMVMLEQTDAFIQALEHFLARVPYQAGV
jgi:pimeloyl-ACP methyl ester carboxylesterase